MVGFPLLLIPLAVYNIIVFLMPGVSLSEPVLRLTLMSGAEWPITLSDMLLAFAALMLLLEIVKAARPGAKFLMDHLLSLIVFGAAAAEFVLWPKFGTSTFFLLTLFALVDFLAGVTLRRRRGMAPAAVSRKAARRAEPEAAEPPLEPAAPTPAPAPSPAPAPAPTPVPSAASVAESVLLDRPVPSPGIQPGNGANPSPDTPSR